MTHTLSRLLTAIFLIFLTGSVYAQSVIRGPYLQQQTDGSIIVRWRTNVATDSYVRYGLNSLNLASTASNGALVTEHSVSVTGMNPLTQYFYSVGDSGGTIAGDASYHFYTAPLIGSPTSTRFWAIGDSGTAVTHPGLAASVRDAYKTYAASSPADFMMMLGDNAYNDGTDTQYQNAVFDTYPELLRQLPVWSTLGNHDGHSADSAAQTGPYYEIFEPPTAGEIGGYPSGTEAYYSFDYGEVHFVCLDSYDSPRGINGSMMTWLESDLASNDKPWVIAFWHHPPYSKGSHNSDSSGEGQMTDMRVNFLPVLEAWGVDLVLTGHSHSYERSFLLDGHYGLSGTLDLNDPSTNVLDWGDGSETGNGVYQKSGVVAAQNEGAVYVVAGSSGKVSGGTLNHPAMLVGLASLGSMVVDIVGNRLDAVFIDQTGAVLDDFTLIKTPDTQAPMIADAHAEDGTHVLLDYSERVDAVSAGNTANYSISGLSISNAAVLAGNKSVRLTTSAMIPNQSYVLTINNVMDVTGNIIAPNSQFGFDFIQLITVSFQDGLAPDPSYTGTNDSYIREASSTTNYGAAVTLQMDGDEPSSLATDMYTVISWNLDEIPATATVQSASIHFNVLNVGSTYYCYQLLRAWDESQVTWNNADSGTAWQSGGALGGTDRDNAALCSMGSGSLGQLETPLNNDGLALVQSWISGASANHGIVIADATSANGLDVDSSESASAMNRPRLEITYSVPAIPSNQPPTAGFSDSCTNLDCNFTDTSTDSDGSVTGWSWDFGDTNGSSAQHPSHSFGTDGTYTVELTVTDNEGAMGVKSKQVTVSVPPPVVEVVANADLPASGTVSGSYVNTQVDDGNSQSITERESGGKKQNRHSFLIHTWQFNLPVNAMATVNANTWSGGSNDDNFAFSWSTDNSNYTHMFTIDSADPVDLDPANLEDFVLPPNTSGTVYIRVEDTDQTPGSRTLDTVFIDHLYILAESGVGGGDPPAAPSSLSATATGSGTISLAWTDNATDESGFRIDRSLDGSSFSQAGTASADATGFNDTGLSGGTTYWYRVYAFNVYGSSANSNIDSAMTDPPPAISLSLNGYKIKGNHNIDLDWSGTGGGDVDIYRDGNPLEKTVADIGSYTDSTSNKGGRTYTYQVCDAGTAECSAVESVTF